MGCTRISLIIVSTCAASVLIGGCAGTNAREGAKAGLVGGAVAGAVGSLFWGGNVVGNMAAGAVTTAAAGAAVGAMQPSPIGESGEAPPVAENRSKGDLTSTDPELLERERELEKRIGPENFEAARRLARCEQDRAINEARKAYKEVSTQEQRAYALMIEAIAEEERGDRAAADAIYPRLVEVDPARGTPEKARNDALSGVLKVQQVRKEYGLSPTCA